MAFHTKIKTKVNLFSACRGGDSCCTSSNKCGLGEGDCDRDHDCSSSTTCGHENCSGSGFDSTDDCCLKPSKRKYVMIIITASCHSFCTTFQSMICLSLRRWLPTQSLLYFITKSAPCSSKQHHHNDVGKCNEVVMVKRSKVFYLTWVGDFVRRVSRGRDSHPVATQALIPAENNFV